MLRLKEAYCAERDIGALASVVATGDKRRYWTLISKPQQENMYRAYIKKLKTL